MSLNPQDDERCTCHHQQHCLQKFCPHQEFIQPLVFKNFRILWNSCSQGILIRRKDTFFDIVQLFLCIETNVKQTIQSSINRRFTWMQHKLRFLFFIEFYHYDYKTHMLIPLYLIWDSTSGLFSSARDVGDVSCRREGIWEMKIELSCMSMDQHPF